MARSSDRRAQPYQKLGRRETLAYLFPEPGHGVENRQHFIAGSTLIRLGQRSPGRGDLGLQLQDARSESFHALLVLPAPVPLMQGIELGIACRHRETRSLKLQFEDAAHARETT